MTPRGIEIVNRRSVKAKPYEVRIDSLLGSDSQPSKKINMFSNGGVFLFTPSGELSAKKVETVVFDNKESIVREYNWYLDSHGLSEVRSPYELEVQMVSCLGTKKTPIKRFKITNRSQSVSYAIDPDYYQRSGVFKAGTAEQCRILNTIQRHIGAPKIKSRVKNKPTVNAVNRVESNQVK